MDTLKTQIASSSPELKGRLTQEQNKITHQFGKQMLQWLSPLTENKHINPTKQKQLAELDEFLAKRSDKEKETNAARQQPNSNRLLPPATHRANTALAPSDFVLLRAQLHLQLALRGLNQKGEKLAPQALAMQLSNIHKVLTDLTKTHSRASNAAVRTQAETEKHHTTLAAIALWAKHGNNAEANPEAKSKIEVLTEISSPLQAWTALAGEFRPKQTLDYPPFRTWYNDVTQHLESLGQQNLPKVEVKNLVNALALQDQYKGKHKAHQVLSLLTQAQGRLMNSVSTTTTTQAT